MRYLMDEEEEETKEEPKEDQPKNSFMESKFLKTRTIVLSTDINSKVAERFINQLLLLDDDNSEKPIKIYINSPGGEVYSGLAIFDMINFIKSPVKTIVSGFAASMGSIISLAPGKGNRYALPNAKVLIHQPLISGTFYGTAIDIEIQAKEMIRTKEKIINIYVEATGKNAKDIKKDIDRDNWMTAEEAMNYGLIDKIIKSKEELD